MGAVEHLKTLCCLGLKPESAMIAVTPLLHEIIPHGWSRMFLYKSDATVGSTYVENPSGCSIVSASGSSYVILRGLLAPFTHPPLRLRRSAGTYICKGAVGLRVRITGKWKRRSIPAGFSAR